MGVPQKVKDGIELLLLHNYAVVLITIVFYVLLHYTMKKKMATGNTLQNESTCREESKHTQAQGRFARLNRWSYNCVDCVFRANNDNDDH